MKFWSNYTHHLTTLYGPRQANSVLIAYASSEGSGEPAHPRSLARTSAARLYKQWVKRNLRSESRGTFRQKARSLAPLNGWACAVKICHDGMLEDTNSLDGAHMKFNTMYRTSASELNAKLCSFDTIRAVFSRTTALILKHAFITPQTVFEDWRWGWGGGGGGGVYTVVRSSFRPSVTLRFSLISWKGSDGNLEIHQTL